MFSADGTHSERGKARTSHEVVRALAALLACSFIATASPDRVVVVINENSPLSKSIGEYYARRRGIPARNVCGIRTTQNEEIQRATYNAEVLRPIAECLKSRNLTQKILYLVTTIGVPLKIAGTGGPGGDCASVDSELALLYSDLRGTSHLLPGIVRNPFFGKRDEVFSHEKFPIYLVTRLAGYDFNDVKGLIDRSLLARNTGIVVLDLRSSWSQEGNKWLRAAAGKLRKDRVLLDESGKVIEGAKGVIGAASWGSNDKSRKTRVLGFDWLPGAIMTEFVSTNGRTFQRPSDAWRISAGVAFGGSEQTLTADYVHEGVTGASGHVYEPYLSLTPRPDLLFPAYLRGRNLAESFYLSIPALSWQNIVVGDPLCRLR